VKTPWFVRVFAALPAAAVFVLVGFAVSWAVAGVIFGVSYGSLTLLAIYMHRRRRSAR